jgi:phosphoribosylformylglycinamidine cyclo-ligase
VLPQGTWVDVDRSTWSPLPVFRVLAGLGGLDLTRTEGTWNLGIGFLAAVDETRADAVIASIRAAGIDAWQVGVVRDDALPGEDFEQGAKGVDGGAVRLVSAYAESGAN